ncbi:ATP-dependent DNA helicase DinG [Alkalispirillum mobile]|uniref:ATP-dependent DNA helicase DinG n=1 Tax=Alkalispirillum mobile TaxID=85925 RepID=A0A498C0C1_9GAMM|nr:ATP-dependent DNA helicase DinG [Alkalispirillum mobile]RLK48753.1 ATP-dependent DNA helicase DinG [Alkalispirillum mobile]
MLEEAVKEEIREALRNVGENVSGFRSRSQQRQMIAEVARTLAGDCDGRRLLAIEGPTGTGKSLAYLLAGIPVARAEGRQLIISTATVALQEQIVDRDLPALQRNSGLDFTYALIKGRRRYVCTRNLEQLVGGAAQGEMDLGSASVGPAHWPRKPEAGELDALQALYQDLLDGRWDGDLDRRPAPAADLHGPMTTDRHGCTGRGCPHVRDCPFHVARRGMEEQDVLVANHDLVLADLAMGGGVILPPPEQVFYVFDEAHHLAARATDAFRAEAPLQGSVQWLEKLPRLAGQAITLLPEDAGRHLEALERSVNELSAMLHEMQGMIRRDWRQNSRDGVWRFPAGELPEPMGDLVPGLRDASADVEKHFGRIGQAFAKVTADEGVTPGSVAERLAPELGEAASRVEHLAATWRLVAREQPPEAPPVARWVTALGHGRPDYLVAASPVSAAAMLRAGLWSRAAGAVLTSATLTALGRFDRMRLACGLEEDDGTRYISLASPFDYRNRAVLHVPRMDSDPRDPEGHTDELIRVLPGLLGAEPGGTLVLFASARQLDAVFEALPADCQARVLRQREQPRADLLAAHARAVEAGGASVIFGLAGFAEGVDLPGELCRHVIIAKLPFAVPDSPVEATLAEWLESRGRNPFMDITVPDAGMKLVQACGRLLRSESDSGRVTVLDRRLITHRYGKALLSGLPPFGREMGTPLTAPPPTGTG